MDLMEHSDTSQSVLVVADGVEQTVDVELGSGQHTLADLQVRRRCTCGGTGGRRRRRSAASAWRSSHPSAPAPSCFAGSGGCEAGARHLDRP
jgi:hypothetical protein